MPLKCTRAAFVAEVMLVCLLGAGVALAQPAKPAPARPVEPVAAIVAALRTHDVVALDGGHDNEQGAAFLERLYRDRRLQMAVNDIVVEFGNGRHQAMMDRYISGQEVPEAELRMAWLETTQPHDVWDRTMYADVFRTIREVNRTLPKQHQLRVLLGDTPFPYLPGEFAGRTDAFPAELIRREVVAKHRKALLVYGSMHLLRKKGDLPESFPPVLGMLLERAGVSVLSIWAHTIPTAQDLAALQPDVAGWPEPSLAMIKDTQLGAAPFAFYYPKGSGMTMRPGPNGPIVIDITEAIGGTMQDQFDAVLYLGSVKSFTYAKLPASLCADPSYVEMRAARMSAIQLPSGGTPADDFRSRCKAALDSQGSR